MNREEPVELTVIARRAGVRIALVRRYLEFGLFEAHPEPAESPRYHQSSAARVARAVKPSGEQRRWRASKRSATMKSPPSRGRRA